MAEAKPSSGADAARSALRKARNEENVRRMSLPSLHLLIWPTPSCVRLSLVIYRTVPGMRRSCTVLRQAEWRPAEVTEEKLVQWGQRALASWLEEHLAEETKQQEG